MNHHFETDEAGGWNKDPELGWQKIFAERLGVAARTKNKGLKVSFQDAHGQSGSAEVSLQELYRQPQKVAQIFERAGLEITDSSLFHDYLAWHLAQRKG